MEESVGATAAAATLAKVCHDGWLDGLRTVSDLKVRDRRFDASLVAIKWLLPGCRGMGDCLRTGKPSRYVTSH